MDEIRIWNLARTEEEIQRKMNSELTGKEYGLKRYYNFSSNAANYWHPCGMGNPSTVENTAYPITYLDLILTNFNLDGCNSNVVCPSECGFANIPNFSTCGTMGTSGETFEFNPQWQSLDCFTQNVQNSVGFSMVNNPTVLFAGGQVFPPFTITSITGMPAGVTASVSQGTLPQTVGWGELVCLTFSGTTAAAAGDYPIVIGGYYTVPVIGQQAVADIRVDEGLSPYNLKVFSPTGPALLGSNSATPFQTSTFSVPQQPGNTYDWTVTGGNIISGLGTNSITVQWGGVGSGNVTLNINQGVSCVGTVSTMDIAIGCSSTPPDPTISGPAIAVPGTNSTYTTPAQAGFTYTWSLASGGTITAGQGTESITIQWNSASGTRIVKLAVTDLNGCPSNQTSYTVTVAVPTVDWVTVTNDATGDQEVSSLLDGLKLEYLNKGWLDSLYFRVTVASFTLPQSQDLGVNILVNVPNGGPTFQFWGNDNNTAPWNRMITAWVTGNAPSNYTGTIGIGDATGVANGNASNINSDYTNLSQNNISVKVAGNYITLGLKRSALVSSSLVNQPITIAAAVGASNSWNDDIYSPSSTISIGVEEIYTKETLALQVYPNPTKNSIIVKSEKPLELEISNVLGETVWHSTKAVSGSIDVSALQPGVYFIHDKGHTAVGKFVKE